MAQGQSECCDGQLVSAHPAREGLEQPEREDTATGPLRAQPESSLAALPLPTSSFRHTFVGSGSPFPTRETKSKPQKKPMGKKLQVAQGMLQQGFK